MKKTVKRIFSGVLSALTILTSVVQPMTAYAGETNPKSYEMQYPALEQVKAQLQEDEIVTVQDYEVEKGSDFDIKTDFSGMKFHSDQVKVTFYEAKKSERSGFSHRPCRHLSGSIFCRAGSGSAELSCD